MNKPLRPWIVASLCAVCALAPNAPAQQGGAQQGPPPVKVRLARVGRQTLASHWDVVGRLREVKRTTVGAGQQGRVIDAPFEEGDTVTGGQTVLARIDETFIQLELKSVEAALVQAGADVTRNDALVAEAEAAVDEAAAELDQAQRDFERLTRLYEAKSAERREYEDSRSTRDAREARLRITKAVVASRAAALDDAKEAVKVATAERQRVLEEIKRFHVMTPGEGKWIVVRKIMEVGQWIQKGAPVAELISVGTIDAVVDVPERYINNIRIGDRVNVTVEALGERHLPGAVVAIIPAGADAARTYPVKVRLDDSGGRYKPGMSVTASVPTSERRPFLTVPRDAVLFSARGADLWLAVDGKAMRLSVEVLFSVEEDRGELSKGRYVVRAEPAAQMPQLAPNMAVVVEGGERLLFSGQAIIAVNDPPPLPIEQEQTTSGQ